MGHRPNPLLRAPPLLHKAPHPLPNNQSPHRPSPTPAHPKLQLRPHARLLAPPNRQRPPKPRILHPKHLPPDLRAISRAPARRGRRRRRPRQRHLRRRPSGPRRAQRSPARHHRHRLVDGGSGALGLPRLGPSRCLAAAALRLRSRVRRLRWGVHDYVHGYDPGCVRVRPPR